MRTIRFTPIGVVSNQVKAPVDENWGSVVSRLVINTVYAEGIKGLGEFLVITRHALRNALVPTVTVVGLTYGLLLEGSVLTETIFSWPGLGRYLANAFLTLDLNTIVGGTMFVALTFCLVNLVVDLAYAYLNPKITYTES